MKMQIYMETLKEIEARIENSYIELQDLENRNLRDSEEYQYTLQYLIDYNNKEAKLLAKMVELFRLKDIRKEIGKLQITEREIPITLGHLPDAYVYRLLYLIDKIRGDDVLDYALTLKTDINHILLAFLNELIDNSYYEEIRSDLILYKYNLIYMDLNLEAEFMEGRIDREINLEASNYRTFDFPGYKYVDRSILALESTDYLSYITTHENFLNQEWEYASMVIAVVNVLARLILCEQDTLDLVYDDLKNIIEAPEIDVEVKNLINNMYSVLDNIKSHIAWSR